MPTFAYQAVSGDGERLRGLEEAASPGALSRTLEERGLLVLDVSESSDRASDGGRFRFGRRRQVLEVTRAMAALLPVGRVRAGERSGDVDSVFARLSDQLERDEQLRQDSRIHAEELRGMAIRKGMRTLQDDDLRLVRAGVTTLDEVLRVARA